MDRKTDAQVAEWLAEARTGVFKSMGRFRRLLHQGEELTPIDREGLVDLLILLEEYVEQTWVPDMATLTQMNSPRG